MNPSDETDRLSRNIEKGEQLKQGEMASFMQNLMTGKLGDENVIRFLSALPLDEVQCETLVEAAQVMRRHALPIHVKAPIILDTCGTGGDGLKSVNVSTLAALIAAAAGVTVAKHGNRAISSLSGSADILKTMGLPMDLTPQETEACINRTGFGFLFAPLYHPAMKYAMPARKRMAKRTIFNVLGPLTNPAGATCQLVGVFQPQLVETLCRALGNLNVQDVTVVHGDGSDEVSLTGETFIARLKNSTLNTFTVNPTDFGFKPVSIDSLRLESAEAVKHATEEILSGSKGPKSDFVALNAGFALETAGCVKDIPQGIELAKSLLQSGKVLKKWEDIRSFAQETLTRRHAEHS